ncbi:MAG: alpha/beta hydrolase fold domain-containing protein, partial [Actinomadura sp.]
MSTYRLSPKATWPDHLIDVKRAIAWYREHAAAYGGDPDFLVVTGGSAGGHLAAMAALTVHGTADSLLPVDGARRFVARLREVSEAPVVYAELK